VARVPTMGSPTSRAPPQRTATTARRASRAAASAASACGSSARPALVGPSTPAGARDAGRDGPGCLRVRARRPDQRRNGRPDGASHAGGAAALPRLTEPRTENTGGGGDSERASPVRAASGAVPAGARWRRPGRRPPEGGQGQPGATAP
jgi:hypothetical protein